MRIQNLFIPVFTCALVYSCAARQIRLTSKISPAEYNALSWEKKIKVFESIDETKKIYPSTDIYASALKDPVPAVVITALRGLPDGFTLEFKTNLYSLLKYKNPVVRMYACQKISAIPVNEDLDYLPVLFSDIDWMPRECVFQNIRNYATEKSKKKYFFFIISCLYEKNPQVLRQIYKTLKWYDDPRAISFMYKRSFLADTVSELMVIMQELVEIRSVKIRQRIAYLSQNHPDYFVKREARKLLSTM